MRRGYAVLDVFVYESHSPFEGLPQTNTIYSSTAPSAKR